MRPFGLKGHERAVTCVRYNRDGDLLFTCSKDKSVQAWYTHNGERLGTYEGHKGAVWSLDVTDDSRYLISGAADSTCRVWDVESGAHLFTFKHETTVRSCAFAPRATHVVTVSEAEMKRDPQLHFRRFVPNEWREESDRTITLSTRLYHAIYLPQGDRVVGAGDDGALYLFDVETGKVVEKRAIHEKQINKLQLSYDGAMLITASSDQSAKLFDTERMECIKTFQSERPINAASISPIMDHVILGGGQEAADVTTTAGQMGKFETTFFHMIFEEEIGRIGGHFGPIHSLQFAPDGKGFTSGSEDGFVRMHHFDKDYLAGSD